jgi:predicted nucleotidyltransferase
MLEKLISSRVRVKLLTAFFLSPGVDHNASELARTLKENYSAVWKELVRLKKLGILKSDQKGNSKAYQVNSACPIAPELRSIILKTEGVGVMVQRRLGELGTVKEAFIYGSYASGEADERSDLDLMIIGKADLEQLSTVIADLEKELNQSINYIIFSEEEWREKLANEDAFALNVNQAPKIILVGGDHALRAPD